MKEYFFGYTLVYYIHLMTPIYIISAEELLLKDLS